MVVDSAFIESSKLNGFYTYCFEKDKKNAVNLLREHIIKKVKNDLDEITNLFKKLSVLNDIEVENRDSEWNNEVT